MVLDDNVHYSVAVPQCFLSSSVQSHPLFVPARMSSNGQASPRTSTSDSRSPRELRSPTVSPPGSTDDRLSFDSERNSLPVNGPNGTANGNRYDDDDEDGDLDPVLELRRQLERTNEEKEHLATQYRSLLAKLTTMRTTLGNKLKQDAVRRPI